MKRKLVVVLVVAVGCAVAGVMIVRQQAAPRAAPQTVKVERRADLEQPTSQAHPTEAPAAPDRPVPEQLTTPQTQPVKLAAPNNVRQQPTAVAPQASQDPGLADMSIPEPLARAALSYVGADRDAEEVWVWAINDTNLTPDERRELIEDLNQTGFPDPRNLTADDLPLIENRIALIEQLAPDAMDEVNDAAFQEAYKDLANMYRRVTGL